MKPLTVSVKASDRVARERLRLHVVAGHAELARADKERPKTRADCASVQRPCPWVSCRHHLYLEVTAAGSIHIPRPDVEPDAMIESCSLDVAERAQSLEDVADILNVTGEAVRLTETRGLLSMRAGARGQIEREDLSAFATREVVEPDHYITGIAGDAWKKACAAKRDR